MNWGRVSRPVLSFFVPRPFAMLARIFLVQSLTVPAWPQQILKEREPGVFKIVGAREKGARTPTHSMRRHCTQPHSPVAFGS